MSDRGLTDSFLARPLSRSGEADLLSAADRLDILDLLYTVGWCIDTRAHKVLATVITKDFVFEHDGNQIEGRNEFLDYLAHDRYFDGLRHQHANPLLRSVDLSNSVAVSYLILTRVAEPKVAKAAQSGSVAGTAGADATNTRLIAPVIIGHGTCTDLLFKDKEIWKLAKRTVDQMAISQ